MAKKIIFVLSMKRHRLRTYRAWLAAGLLVLLIGSGCAPKMYVKTYSDPGWDSRPVDKVIVVLDDRRGEGRFDRLFAEMFIKAVRQKKPFIFAEDRYKLKKDYIRPTDADAILEIALTHGYPGYESAGFPTSVGAVAKIVDAVSGKTLWQVDYAYASAKGGASAPPVNSAIQVVVDNMIEALPLAQGPVIYAAYTPPGKDPAPVLEEKHGEGSPAVLLPAVSPPPDSGTARDPIPATEAVILHSANWGRHPPFAPAPAAKPYVVHVASVKQKQLAERFMETHTDDGTVRLSTMVNLNPENPWYRLLIGRFGTIEESRTHIYRLKQKGIVHGYAKPLKLPYTLLISSDRPLESSTKIAEALRKIDYMAYLSPSGSAVDRFDVRVGAFATEREADERAELLRSNGIPVQVITP